MVSSANCWNGAHPQKNSSSAPEMPCWKRNGSDHLGSSYAGQLTRRTSVIVENRLSSSAGFLPASAG